MYFDINVILLVWQHGSLAGPFGPVVDGEGGILPESPKVLRDKDQFMKIHILAGINKDEASYVVRKGTFFHLLFKIIITIFLQI